MEIEENKIDKHTVILTYSDDIKESLREKCNEINNNMIHLMNLSNDLNTDANIIIDDYATKMTNNIYLIFDMFKEMRICPDQFYNIIFKANDAYLTLISKGMAKRSENLYTDLMSFEEISEEIEKALNTYKTLSRKDTMSRIDPMISRNISKKVEEGLQIYLKPTEIPPKTIDEYYEEMLDFMRRHYLPCEVVNDVNMCREALGFISNNDSNSIKSIMSASVSSDYIDVLCRFLFSCFQFVAAIGVNPKDKKQEEEEKSQKNR